MQENKQLWDNCLLELEGAVSKANFNTWFKNTNITKQDGGTIYVGVPNEFVKDWLYNKFNKLILKTLMTFSDQIRGIEYVISKHEPKAAAAALEQKSFANRELPLRDLYINKEDNLNPR